MATTISPKFAHLPNAIIREIIAYTGVTFKKRNGTYMGQIPHHDPRYALLRTIPPKHIVTTTDAAYTYFCSTVFLLKTKRNDMYLRVSGLTHCPIKKSYINTRFTVFEGNKCARRYEYHDEEQTQISFSKERIPLNESCCDTLWVCSTIFVVIVWLYGNM
jgi:hypothetical protein